MTDTWQSISVCGIQTIQNAQKGLQEFWKGKELLKYWLWLLFASE
jgi:hypothetical protein